MRRPAAAGCVKAAAVALWAMSCCTSAPAAVYKWVDETGATHYDDASPPPGHNVKKLDIQTAPAAGTVPPTRQGGADWQQKELEFQQRRVRAEELDRQKQAEAAAREQRCARARQSLGAYERMRRVYRVNENGERVYLDDKEREELVARARSEIQANCRD